MGTKYTSQASSGYNSNPPSDDGTVSAANKVTWATIKSKLPDPLKTFIEAVNTQLVTAFDYSATAQAAPYTTVAADHQKPIEVTGTTTISLGDAASMAVGYQAIIVNRGTNTVTVALATGANTLDGVAAGTVALAPNQTQTFGVNQAANGYRTLSGGNEMPAGVMVDYGGATAPAGWLLCDGSAVSRTTFANLFTAIGTTWGVGNGSTTFNIPDFRRRVAVGSGGSGTGTLGNAVGNTGGEETHTLTSAETPTHAHSASGNVTGATSSASVYANSAAGGGDIGYHAGQASDTVIATASFSVTTSSFGGGGAHNNMQPSAVVLKIIKT